MTATAEEIRTRLGAALATHRAGRLDEAEAAYRAILADAPGEPNAGHLLGLACLQAGRLVEAEPFLAAAASRAPDNADCRNNLAEAHRRLGRFEEAAEGFARAIAARPDFAEAWCNLGLVRRAQGRLDEALAAFDSALAARPDMAAAHGGRGFVLCERRDFLAGEAALRRAVTLDPGYAEGHNGLGAAGRRLGRIGEAIACYQRAVTVDPDFAEAWNNLGNALTEGTRHDEALAVYRRALAIRSDYRAAGSNLLLCMNYMQSVAPAEIAAAHRDWAARHLPAPPNRALGPRIGNRPLRVGYVSPDFREHPVSHFLAAVFAAHDRARIELVCYADATQEDAMTARLRAHAALWRSTVGLSDAALAQQVVDDRIDLLVDLAGHTAGNRLGAFALKSAPVQATWLGYPNTTGLAAIDYRLTDAVADPPGEADTLHVEKLFRLPDGFLCFTPPDDAPPVAARADGGSVVFGSFNMLAKINEATLALWARILARVPQARLALKAAALADPGTRDLIATRFTRAGGDAGRLDLLPATAARTDHLGLYGRIDIALDPFPYGGTTTTCEALWMGVPVVTLAGERHAGRVGASLLARVGLDELVARNADDYVAIAAAFATDGARRAALRAGLRDRLAASPLCNAPRFARALEDAYRRMLADRGYL
ncbi:MAG: tetratricopeptide repeat protein [Rhodospirillales bacterium]|nr:tetratricopeptide repeat protein [Rhodospirillales bacterium]